MVNEYHPLHNLQDADTKELKNFTTNKLKVKLENPLNIQCQPSYDGSVNLLLNDDYNPPRIINSGFTKIENDCYRRITRNQLEQTNVYKEDELDAATRLCKIANTFVKFDLEEVGKQGQLKGGNYTFYLRYMDDDKNKTSVLAESGQIPIFHGTYMDISTISGTVLDERTDHSITLKISNVDTTFSKVILSYSREYCTANGMRMTEAQDVVTEYDITGDEMFITITGYEDTLPTTLEQLNVVYDKVNHVKTQAQVQNMLFFGNVDKDVADAKDLQAISYHIKATCEQGTSIGYVDSKYTKLPGDDVTQVEYYNPKNVYYKLGYWPDEMYRMGIVYVLNNDSLTEAYSLRGCDFNEVGKTSNLPDDDSLYVANSQTLNYLPVDKFLANHSLDNTYGVFRTPKCSIINNKSVNPLYFKFTLSAEVQAELAKRGVKGYFFVRQKRLATTLCQGFTMGINKVCHIPMPYFESTY